MYRRTSWRAFPRVRTDHPLVYEVNTRVWLGELGINLAGVPEGEIDRLAGWGVDYVWLMGVWQTGARGRAIARREPGLRAAYDAALRGWTEDDVVSSPYAVAGYHVADELGGPTALATFRERLAHKGIGLILDFIPNHLALDHPWVAEHPEWFVHAADGQIAHGRDPYFPAWTDTAQLDHRHPGLRTALTDELVRIADQCDGVRCDMAMLVLREVFERTWSGWPAPGHQTAGEFWSAAIPAVRSKHPIFLMLGEAYWDTEWRLQQLGFDYLYDKRLYDRLADHDAPAARAHLRADDAFQRRLCRFVENHDEARSATVWPGDRLRAALVAGLTLPGLRLVHEGQVEGRRRRLPVQLARRADEPPDPQSATLHAGLFAALATAPFRRGVWRLVDQVDIVDTLAWVWDAGRFGQAICVAHLSDRPAQVRVHLPLLGLADRTVGLEDHLGSPPIELADASQGVPLDLAPWDARIYAIR
jgi:glycosidase